MRVIARYFSVLFAAVLLVSGCGGDDAKKEQKAAAPRPVKVIKAETRNVPIYMEWAGQVVAKNSVDVQARVEGYLKERLFKEGSRVEEGQLLFVIDPQPFEEDLREAQADLESAKAELAKANADLKRYSELMEQEVISRSQFDSVKTDQATLVAKVKRAQASVQNSKINLGYTRISAPISGVIGESNYDVGALVGPPNNSLLAKVSAKDQMYVKFALSEKEYLTFVRAAKAKTEQERAKDAGAELILSDGSVYGETGKMDMAEPELDPKTGTLGVRLVFPNPDNLLIPGQFAKVRAKVRTKDDALVIPRAVVMDVQGSKSVYVVEEGIAKTKSVKLGSDAGSLVVVESGLKAGDMVMVENLQTMRPGTKVEPKVVPYPDQKSGDAGAEPAQDSGKEG